MVLRAASRSREAFVLESKGPRCLLLHGFTGDPGQVRPLGDYLHRRGYAVVAPCLVGHGGHRVTSKPGQWVRSALDASAGSGVAVGLSLGGLLALDLARRGHAHAVVCINAPLYLSRPLDVIKKLVKGSSRPGDIQAASLGASLGLYQYIRRSRRWLHEVKVPVLVIQAHQDLTVNPASARLLYDGLGSRHRELWYCHGTHLAILEAGRERIFQRVHQFIESLEVEHVEARGQA